MNTGGSSPRFAPEIVSVPSGWRITTIASCGMWLGCPSATDLAHPSVLIDSVSFGEFRSQKAMRPKLISKVVATASTIVDPSFARIVGSFSRGRIATTVTP